MAYPHTSYTFPAKYADTFMISYRRDEQRTRDTLIHTHDCDEILFIRGGNIQNYSGNDVAVYSGACIVYNKAGDPHLTMNTSGALYERYNIRYSRSVLEKHHVKLPVMNSFLCPLGEQDENLFLCAELLWQDYSPLSCSPEEERAKTHLLASLLIRTFRLAQNYSMSPLPTSSAYIRSVLQYILLHYAEELTLDRIAQQFFVGKTKLCRDFRTYTGTSVAAYITTLRMENAKEYLLAGTGVRKTAELVGYEYVSNFIKVFSRTTGVTPLQFKRSAGM